MRKIIAIPANGPDLSDTISEHFGHCNYYLGVQINEDQTFEKTFSIQNNGHTGCMEPVMNLINKSVTEVIVGGIGGRPYMGFIQLGIPLNQGIVGRTVRENVELFINGKLTPLKDASCGGDPTHTHN
ncbi:MAG: dinitrogenase iron-molybdenum cofactor biosynthesis protein [Promethearchaeota archaeon]|nr:MAG: dinitrogenase iron-molybdenum cofactor biosynthesis protein [Candidatus Lokiarchaeota archaeon]